jgi:hypothetical protein
MSLEGNLAAQGILPVVSGTFYAECSDTRPGFTNVRHSTRFDPLNPFFGLIGIALRLRAPGLSLTCNRVEL